MTSTIVSKPTKYNNGLPEDIFCYNHDQFYQFVKNTYGTDLAELFSFQAIRNATHLLAASCDDVLLILQEESDEVNKLKELCCFKISDNKYQVKLGVKLAINSFIQSLKVKQEQQKKKKRSSKQYLSSNLGIISPINEALSQNEEAQSESASPVLPARDTLSRQSKTKQTQEILDEFGHVADIEQRLNKWWITINDDENAFLEEGVHYFLEINKSLNDKYACIIACQCHARFKLSFMTTGFFKLSSFFRHIKEKQCLKQHLTTKHGKKSSSVASKHSSTSQSKLSDSSSIPGPKKKKSLTNSGTKRFRSPSTQTLSDTDGILIKKNRPLSSNTTNISQTPAIYDIDEN